MLLKIAMHYRWNYLNKDRPFTEATFGHFFSSRRDMDLQRKDIAPLMSYFDGFLKDLAVTEATAPAIEASYLELLDVLNAHFLQCPYLLGGKPSPADFGLMAPMFAHLCRDPHSSHVTKLRAPQVFRWTERMNTAGIVDGEFPDLAPEYPDGDELPATLLPILRFFFDECGPEIVGMVENFNAWCDKHPDAKPGTALRTDPESLTAHPMLGEFTYESRGVKFHRQTYASALYGFQRALDVVATLDKPGREKFDETIRRVGGETVIGVQMNQRIKLENDQYTLE